MPSPLVITMGDPLGVGIEICLKTWLGREDENLSPFCLIGDEAKIRQSIENHGLSVPIKLVSNLGEVASLFSAALPLLDPKVGSTSPEQTIAAIDKAVSLCLNGEASAMVTAPIQKKRLYDDGFNHPGHTEYLADLTGVSGKEVMMLASTELRVVPVTGHIPFTEVPKQLTSELVESVIRTVQSDLKKHFGITAPRIAVAGLNPHAGEGGSIGIEDETILAPLIKRLSSEGIGVAGPHSADTLFHKSAREKYDVAVCMYHDQALIPIKTIDFDGGVNVTLGLPIIRTSPDHGTADDIAGKGIANPASLIAAIKMASEMAKASENTQ